MTGQRRADATDGAEPRRTRDPARRRPTGAAGSRPAEPSGWPSSRTSCGARSPTSTTSASGSPGRSTASARPERARVAGGVAAGRRQPRPRPRARRRRPGADRRGRPGGPRPGARACWPGSASRASSDVGEPFDPARHEAVGAVEADAPRRAPSCAVVRPGYGDGRAAAAARRGRGGQGPELMAAAHATSTRCSACRATPTPDEIQRAYRKLARTLPPRRQQGPGRRGAVQGDLRGVRRAVRSRDAPPLRRVRARLPPGARRRRPADRGRGPGPGGGRRRARARPAGARRRRVVHERRRRGHRLRGPASASMFGGGGRRGLGADPRRRPGGRARRSPSRRRTAAAAARSPCPGPTGSRTLDVDDPARGHRRAAHPAGRPGRPGHAAAPPPATCTWSCGSRRTPATASTAATSTSTCRSRPGRRRSAPRSPVDTPGGEAKVHGARRARRAGGGCGCAAGACRTRAARPATCTPRSGSWCRRSSPTRSASCSRSWPRRRPSTRGGER